MLLLRKPLWIFRHSFGQRQREAVEIWSLCGTACIICQIKYTIHVNLSFNVSATFNIYRDVDNDRESDAREVTIKWRQANSKLYEIKSRPLTSCKKCNWYWLLIVLWFLKIHSGFRFHVDKKQSWSAGVLTVYIQVRGNRLFSIQTARSEGRAIIWPYMDARMKKMWPLWKSSDRSSYTSISFSLACVRRSSIWKVPYVGNANFALQQKMSF